MKLIKRLLVILLVLCLGLAAYFLGSTFFLSKRIHAADVISPEAILVYETTEPVRAWNHLVSQPVWERLADIPSLKDLEGRLLALDSLAGRSGNLERSLRGNNFVLSLHRTGNSEFGFLFSVDFPDQDHAEFIRSLTEKINPNHIHSRSYSGVNIFEYHHPTGGGSLSYAVVNNLLLASYSSFLIEDAIRYAKTAELNGFKTVHSALYNDLPEPTGMGVFRITSAGIGRFIQGISSGQDLRVEDILLNNDFSANLEVVFEEDKLVLNGSSFIGGEGIPEPVWDASGQPHPFIDYISTRTAVYQQYDLSEPEEIKTIAAGGHERKSTLAGEMEKSFDEQLFFDRLNGQIGFMALEESGSTGSDRILLLKTEEADDQADMLKTFNLNLIGGGSDLPVQEYYRGSEIFVIEADEFPSNVFGGKFWGFPNTYAVAYEDQLVMGNSMRAIRIFLDDVHNDNTWSKSVRYKKFLESMASESGYAFWINIPRFWHSLIQVSNPDWKVFFQKYAPNFKTFDWVVLQKADQSTHVTIPYNLHPIEPVPGIVLAEKMAVNFDDQLIYGPKAIRNFNDKSSDYLVQDEFYNVHLISDDGSHVFSHKVEGEVVGDIFQIDYYKNGKLQLLFASGNSIYAFDRLGGLLPGYPVRLSEGESISHLNLVDYDHNRDYRYFVGTVQGNLYLLDKNGNKLEGWSPKSISTKPATAPAHHRFSGVGDFMMALNQAGELYIMNRKGELRTGTPIQLGESISTDYALVERGGPAGTQLVTINDEGEVVHANFNGELTYRNQLLRPDRDTRFHLIKDQSGHRYLFVLHEYNKVTVLNEEAEPLFEKGIFSDELLFQFFSFGAGKDVFVVVDQVQEFIYLYDLDGELLNSRPLNGSEKVEVQYTGSSNEYSILAVHGNRLSEYKMPL